MTTCFFVTDLHGNIRQYESLFHEIIKRKPEIVFVGGDLLPNVRKPLIIGNERIADFISEYLIPGFRSVKKQLGANYPAVFVIMGNDDHRDREEKLMEGDREKLWKYLNNAKSEFGSYTIYGYPFVPPTPFQCKDWEKYDVSGFTEPGSVPPTEGYRTVEPDYDAEDSTIQIDLKQLTKDASMDKAVFLFHSPPYDSYLDRAGLDGKFFDYVPLDVHVGSIAIQRFIEQKQPYITMHGHIHESAAITGFWKQQFGRTYSFSAAHNGPELALVVFDLNDPTQIERELI